MTGYRQIIVLGNLVSRPSVISHKGTGEYGDNLENSQISCFKLLIRHKMFLP